MAIDQSRRAFELLEAALEQAPEDRPAFLEEACAGDKALRTEVEGLLAAEAEVGTFLEPPVHKPVMTLTAVATGASQVGKRIGRYVTRREIASGGMGTVYEAVQDSPRRIVALKVMKGSIDSKSAMRRFEYESQILARLRHPCIAQVFEAGLHEADSGAIPYFAMEFVPNARPITDYSRQKNLGIRERLALFAIVCEAVGHGHQKGIIHRDLKPSNILVDSSGQPKIIDFGVARAIDSDVALATFQTDVGQLVGTLQYMSPEQCDGDPTDLDIRSDVYALGVVLYELLCKRLPYEVSPSSIYEGIRIIREHQPPSLRQAQRSLGGDVEAIVLKALDKDRNRRYSSAAGFGQDIERFLAGKPISAHRDSTWYVLRKTLYRHRLASAVAGAFLVLLVAATIISATYWRRSEREAANARDEAQKAERVSRFMEDILLSLDPWTGWWEREIPVLALLDGASEKAETELADQPEAQARVRFLLGRIFMGHGLQEEAETHFRAIMTSRNKIGKEHPVIGKTLTMLAWLLRDRGDFTSAEELFREAIGLHRQLYGNDHALVAWNLVGLADVQHDQGNDAEAERLYRDALAMDRRLKDGDLHVAWCLANLGVFLHETNNYAAAEKSWREALHMYRDLHDEEHPDVASSMYRLGRALHEQGKHEEAERYLRSALRSYKSLYDNGEHRDVPGILSQMAAIASRRGDADEAREHIRKALSVSQRLTERSQATTEAFNDYAWLLLNCEPRDMRDPTIALEAALSAVEKTNMRHPRFLKTLAQAYHANGDAEKAIVTLEQALSLLSSRESRLGREIQDQLNSYRKTR